jgi:hypothetical protein
VSSPVLVTTTQQLRDAIFTSERVEAETGTVVAVVSFPQDVNCFLLDTEMDPALIANLERVGRSAGRTVLCLSMWDLSVLAGRLPAVGDVVADLVAAGSSARALAVAWQRPLIHQEIVTLAEAREREKRQLRASTIEVQGNAVVFDDVAVSGVTMAHAVSGIRATGIVTSLLGMALDSRRTRGRIFAAGAKRVDEVIRYSRVGGGKPPVNSVTTLVNDTYIRNSIAERYFGGAAALDFICGEGVGGL